MEQYAIKGGNPLVGEVEIGYCKCYGIAERRYCARLGKEFSKIDKCDGP